MALVMSRRSRTTLKVVAPLLATLAIALVLIQAIGSGRNVQAPPPPAAVTAGGPVLGETYLWRPVAIGGGGFITGYSSDLTGRTRVARADVYGAYIWEPEPGRWTQLVTSAAMPEADQVQDGMNEGVFEIAAAPGDAMRLYMAAKGRVYRSEDRGTHWVRASTTAPFPVAFDPNSEFRHYGPFMAVSPVDPDLVFFGTPANGLWRSDNAGAAWSKVTSVPDGRDLRPAPGVQSPGVVIWFEKGAGSAFTGRIWAMSTGHGVFVSSDGGHRFTPLSPARRPQPLTLKQGSFAPDGSFYAVDAEGSAAWRYSRGEWTVLNGQSGLMPRWGYAAVAVNPRTADIYIFDEGGTPFRSVDEGISWMPLSHRSQAGDGDPPWLRVSDQSYFATGSVQFDPVTPDRLWVGAGTGVYFADVSSSARQIVWTSQTRGIEELVANDVIQAPGQSPLFGAADFGVHVKDDLSAYSTSYGPKERVLIAVQQLDWSPSNPKFVVTNASDTRLTCCAEDGDAVLAGYSLDGGREWTRFASLPQPPGTNADDPWRMAFGTIAVSAGDVNNIVWAPSFNKSPFYTTDLGKHWTRVALPGERLPATGSHAQYWAQRKTLAADRVLSGVFYLVHSGDGANGTLAGVWRTLNRGTRWTKVFTGEIAPSSRFTAKLRAVPGEAGHLFFTSGVADAADTWLRRSVDGGETWRALATVDRVDDVAFGKAASGASYPTIFVSGRVAGQYGIWRSTDNAANWTRIASFPMGTLDQVTVLEGDKDVFGRVYLGYKGSGWIHGEPAACTATSYRQGADRDCVAVDTRPVE